MLFKNFYLILLASGTGKRAGLHKNIPKQLWQVNGKPLIWYSLNIFRKFFTDEQIIITYTKEFEKKFLHFFKKFNIKATTIYGGERRQDSVRNAFTIIENNKGFVLIHDAARPIINKQLVERVIEGTKKFGACIPVVPISDTVKIVEKNWVKKTLDRNLLALVQTPQGYSIELLKKAFEQINFSLEYTDEASIVEQISEKIYTVAGEKYNLKLTFPEDLNIIKTLLKEYYEF